MKKVVLVVVGIVFLAVIGCGGAGDRVQESPELEVVTAAEPEAESASETEVRSDIVYVCNCGEECKCGTVKTASGTCECGIELKWAHVVKIEGSEALLCTCQEGCTCTIDPEDESKCSCGNDLRRVSLDGTGLYYCNCGGSCTCNHVSSEEGTCGCGMALKTT